MNWNANRKAFCSDLTTQLKADDKKLIKKQDEIYDVIDNYVENCNANISAVKNNNDIKIRSKKKQEENVKELIKSKADLDAQNKVTEVASKKLEDEINKLSE